MTPERWQHIKEVFASALERVAAERAAFLDETCAGDEALRREVERLLASYDEEQSFMESPAVGEVATQILKKNDSEPRSGQVLGRYKIIRRIGEGGMGEVYLAEDTSLGRRVALKLLPDRFITDEDRLRRFEREAFAASSLNHPNILTIYEVGEAEGTRFIATEYVEGETLREYMTRYTSRAVHGGELDGAVPPDDHPGRSLLAHTRMKIDEMLDISVQVSSALAAAHDAGVVHRDIKPENIMLRRDHVVKVLDFGLAKLTEQQWRVSGDRTEGQVVPGVLTDAGMVMGTVSYMSPEQSQGSGRVDHRTDIWSLGVVLYEMVAGRVPFGGKDIHRQIISIQEQVTPPLSRYTEGVLERLEEIVQKSLAKDPDDRYQSAKDLHIDLRNLKRKLEVDAEIERLLPSESSGLSGEGKQNGPPSVASSTQVFTAAQTTESGSSHTTSSAEYIVGEIKRHRRSALVALAFLAIAAVGVVLVLFKFTGQRRPRFFGNSSRTVPFTSFPGQKSGPAFSPDGNQIAFIWDGNGGDNPGVYVNLINAGSPLQLTSNNDSDPAWSPDGRYIAFVRRNGERGIFMVPALGGPERKLTDIASTFAWAPDGKALAVASRGLTIELNGIFLLSLETGNKRRLTASPSGSFSDTSPAFSPDGQTVAFIRSPNFLVGDIYVVPVAGGEPRRLTSDNLSLHGSPAWTADGREVVFSSPRGGLPSLWMIRASGGQPRRLNGIGEYAGSPSISRQGNRLAYVYIKRDTNIWRVAGPNSTAKDNEPVKLVGSTRDEVSPQFSPDGKRIVFVSDRSGSKEVWVSASNGENAIQLTNFGGSHTGTPRWSPDGRQIAFDSRPEGRSTIYVISAEGSKPRGISAGTSEDVMPSWSRDGRFVYFGSRRSGDWQVWKTPVEGGEAVQVTKQGGCEALESADGKYVYYAKHRGSGPGIWRVPVEGGEESRILDRGEMGYWALLEEGICILDSEAIPQPAIEFFNFATRRMTQLARIDKAKVPQGAPGLAVSQDGHWVLYWQVDEIDNDIMLVENFR